MLWGAASGALELRADNKGGVRVSGRFPYNHETELAPGRAERIEARAFAARIEAGEDIHLLFGHDYQRPLASRQAGSLEITDTDDALEFRATINGSTSWAADFLAAHEAGLIRGMSPGFRVSKGGERIERRGDGLLRSVSKAELFEISAVTRGAYGQAQIEARAWECDQDEKFSSCTGLHPLNRWRL
ncbi:HK97 family phage prohead protease [Aliiroseovarius sp. S2029]|uniref:HK97 family phage prohead protease n=1 Tax=Aliiroseovarius sp. S2029 TaxID=2936988 RepID=UPI0020BE26E8|nr:HK97 family phage prohead protease [Aliiroseovarius sp. S2029]MCK8483955.1 HK97 family phage prohead protease [Aliiroseovarius sp. S2029]